MRSAWGVAALSCARSTACTCCACSGVAVRPVPIAQTGSYATTTSLMQCPLVWITAASWRLTTSSVLSASRSASVSPTQTIGVMPQARAALALSATTASVSPWYWGRSEWPTMQKRTPNSRSMAAETSPV